MTAGEFAEFVVFGIVIPFTVSFITAYSYSRIQRWRKP